MDENNKPIVLTIAGSDPSGGAGIQADIRAFELCGVYGMSVITAITVQIASEVKEWKAIDTELVKKQLYALLEEYPIQFVKTGMIPNKEIAQVVVEAKKMYNFQLLVDPIIKSGNGSALIGDSEKEIYRDILFPSTDLLVPNGLELEAFTGVKVEKIDDVIEAGHKFEEMGIHQFVLKGGHINPNTLQVIDYLYSEGSVDFSVRERVNEGTETHGTGCIFSSLLLGELALTGDIATALEYTEKHLELLFSKLYRIPTREGKSKSIVIDTGNSAMETTVMEEVAEVYEYISHQPGFVALVPEVKTNISICIPGATKPSQVAAIDGRVTIVNGMPKAAGNIKMGVSNHTARLVLTAHQKDANIRAVINLRYRSDYVKAIAEEGLYLFQIERSSQSDKTENQTMQWIIQESYNIMNKIPDIIWDAGEPEKEPIMRLFAQDGQELIEKIKLVIRAIRKIDQN